MRQRVYTQEAVAHFRHERPHVTRIAEPEVDVRVAILRVVQHTFRVIDADHLELPYTTADRGNSSSGTTAYVEHD